VRCDEQRVPASTSWLQAPSVSISARLRATGQYQRRGMLPRVVDRTNERRLLADQIAAERYQAEQARRRFATGQPMRLSDLGVLDRQEFALFLCLLSDALAAGPADAGVIHTLTSDGTLAVMLAPTDDGAIAEIHTPHGVFRGPDHILRITDINMPAPRLEVAAIPA
jgi:uncharacterized protein (TIGR02677 family)